MLKSKDYHSFEKIKRLLFIEYLKKIGSLIENKQISCFFSYAWGNDEHKTRIQILTECLNLAGIEVWFDLKDNSKLGCNIDDFIKKINEVNYIVLFGSSNLISKLKKEDSIIKDEIEYMKINGIFDSDKLCYIDLEEKKIALEEIGISSKCRAKRNINKHYKSDDLDVLIEIVFDLLLKFFLDEQEQNIIKNIYVEFELVFKKTITKYSPERIEEYFSFCESQNPRIELDICQLLKTKYHNKFNLTSNQFEREIITLPLNIHWSYYQNAASIYNGESIDDLVTVVIRNCLSKNNSPVMIAGGLANGKTTLCKHITSLWMLSDPILADFKLVFFIEVNNLHGSRYPASLLRFFNNYTEIDVIVTEFFSYQLSDFMVPILLDVGINRYKNEILWIIDGHEELSSDIIPEHLKAVIAKIKTYPHVIITTSKHLNKSCYYRLTNFDNSSKAKYIEKFFYQQGQKLSNNATKLLNFFDGNQMLYNLASIPGVLKIVCDTWLSYAIHNNTELAKNEAFNLSITTLYTKISNFILYRKSSQFNEYRYSFIVKNKLIRFAVKKIAWIINNQGKSQFEFSDLKRVIGELTVKYKSIKSQLDFNFQDILNTGIFLQKQNCLEFVDHSLSVFLVAEFLVENLQECCDDFVVRKSFVEAINAHRYIHEKQLLLIFMSGLLGTKEINSESKNFTNINKLFWQTICKPFDVVGINHLSLLLKCLAQTDYLKIFEYYPNMKFYILDFFKYIFQHEECYIFEGVKTIFLALSADAGIMDLIININDNQKLLQDLLEFIYVYDETFDLTMQKCFFSLSPSSRQKLENLLRENFNSEYSSLVLVQVSNLIAYLQSGVLDLKRSALIRIYNQKIYHPQIIDIISATIINPTEIDLTPSITLFNSINKQTFFIRNLYVLCVNILYSMRSQGELSDIATGIAPIKKDGVNMISFLHQKLFKRYAIYPKEYNQLNFPTALNGNSYAANHSDDDYYYGYDYGYDYDYDYDLNIVVPQALKPRDYWEQLILNQTKLHRLSDDEINCIFKSSNYFLNMELIALIQAFSSSGRAVLGEWIIRRLIHNCHKEVLLIVDSGIIIYHQGNAYSSVVCELWKNDTSLQQAFLKALKKYWSISLRHLIFPFRQPECTLQFYYYLKPPSMIPVESTNNLEDIGIPWADTDGEAFELTSEEVAKPLLGFEQIETSELILQKMNQAKLGSGNNPIYSELQYEQDELIPVTSSESTTFNSTPGGGSVSCDSISSLPGSPASYLRYCKSNKDPSLFSCSLGGSVSSDSISSLPGSPVNYLRHCQSNNTSLFDSTQCGSEPGDYISSPPVSPLNYSRNCKFKDTSLFNEVNTSVTLREFSRKNINFTREEHDPGSGSSNPSSPKNRIEKLLVKFN